MHGYGVFFSYQMLIIVRVAVVSKVIMVDSIAVLYSTTTTSPPCNGPVIMELGVI